jgi:DNA-binding NarL/FixJ family response regulator
MLVKIVVVDGHPIYRRGLVATFHGNEDVIAVAEAATPEEAWQRPELPEADVVIVDDSLDGACDFTRRLREVTGASVVMCVGNADQGRVMSAIQAGAVGFLCKDTLTPETLVAAVQSAATGTGVMAPELMNRFVVGLARVSREVLEPRGLSLSRLTEREQQVLSLIAKGHATREVAEQLCYSERTVKNVLHDVVTKLNARTRTEAVACAVREGLI